MALRMLTINLFYFIICEDLHEHKFVKLTLGWGPSHIWFHTTLEDPWPHYMILEVCWDGLWTLSFGLSQFHDHGSWLACEVALKHATIIGWPFCYGIICFNPGAGYSVRLSKTLAGSESHGLGSGSVIESHASDYLPAIHNPTLLPYCSPLTTRNVVVSRYEVTIMTWVHLGSQVILITSCRIQIVVLWIYHIYGSVYCHCCNSLATFWS